MTVQPFMFAALGLLLYHVGPHVHALNQNAILMAGGSGPPKHATPTI
jgi:hypothetical protein